MFMILFQMQGVMTCHSCYSPAILCAVHGEGFSIFTPGQLQTVFQMGVTFGFTV